MRTLTHITIKNVPDEPLYDGSGLISGIIHVLRIGCRWQDCASDHGPSTTIRARFNRWSHRGLRARISATLAVRAELPDDLSIDGTAIRAHRSAQGGKGGYGHRAPAWRSDRQNPCPDRGLRASSGVHSRPRKSRRYRRGGGTS